MAVPDLQSAPIRTRPRLALVLSAAFVLLVADGLVVQFASPAHAQARKNRRVSMIRTTQILVTSLTSGAEIYIDGEKVATVPMQDPIEMAPGEHVIKITKPGYADFFETLDFPAAAEPHVVEADLFPISGLVKIESVPSGASVLVDGEFRGQTPFEGEIEVGARTLSVTLAGYVAFTETTEIVAGDKYSFKPVLEVVVGPPEFYETWWLWTGVAVVVTGAVVTVMATSGDDEVVQTRATDGTIDLRTLQLSW